MLTNKQNKLLEQMLLGKSISESCRVIGMSRTTAYKYIKLEEFQSELRRRKTQILEDVSLQVQIHYKDVITKLLGIIMNPKTPSQIVVNGCDTYLRHGRQLIEDIDVMSRIQAVEDVQTAEEGDEYEE